MVGVVAGVSSAVAPDHLSTWRKHERPTQLMPVLFGTTLGAVASLSAAVQAHTLCAAARDSLRGEAENLPHAAVREIHCLVRAHVGREQNGEADSGLLLERASLGRRAHAYEPDIWLSPKHVAVTLKLHRANAALYAQIVAQEHKRRGTLTPKIVQRHLVALLILKHESRERAGRVW